MQKNCCSALELNTGESWIGRAVMFGISLLLASTLAYAVFDYAVPKVSDEVQRSTGRVGWYLRNGQWNADVRTLAAAIKFIVDGDPDVPVQTSLPGK